jgi:hypothetical protein
MFFQGHYNQTAAENRMIYPVFKRTPFSYSEGDEQKVLKVCKN